MAKTILVVDDAALTRSMLNKILSEEGYRIIEAGNAKEALEKARKEKPDLVLTDTTMPDMDGHELCRQIKQVENLPVKVIIYTATIDAVDAVKARRMGADDYVVKAQDASIMIDAIKKLIE